MKKNKLLLLISILFFTSLIITLPNIIYGKGIFTLIADINVQQIPFITSLNRSIKTGNIFWSWYSDFGSNFIGTFSFYNVFSPFNLITLIFNANMVKYLIGPILIIKYMVAGFTSYLYLKRYVKNKNYAIIGSLLYAFSGYQLTNMLFYHFHDVVAFFPLLLYSFDNLIYENKKSFFGIIVFLSAITNWFFFIGEVIFLVLYYLIKIISKEIIFKKNTFIRILIESFLGVLMACVILIPTAYFIKDNPRLSNSWNLISMFKYPPNHYFEILRAFISPAQSMSYRALITSSNYSSCELYLPLVGILFVVPYIIKNKKSWETILFLTLLFFSLIPFLNSSFILFQTTYYARWFYMITLITTLITIKSMEKNLNITSGVITTLIILAFLIFFVIRNMRITNAQQVFDYNYVIILLILMFTGIIITMLIKQNNSENLRIKLFIIAISIFTCIIGNYTIYKYKINKEYDSYIRDYYNLHTEINKYKNFRSNSEPACIHNLGYIGQINNIHTWNSNTNGSTFEFLKSIGIFRDIATSISIDNYKLNSFLGAKYIFVCNNYQNLEEYNYKFIEDLGIIKVYENNNDDVSLVHELNKYMLEKDFNKQDFETRINSLTNYLIIDKKQEKKYKKFINSSGNIFESKFEYLKNGFKIDIKSDHESFVVITVPYDKGWKAYNNRKQISYEKVDNGLIGIKIRKGNNHIIFKYEPKGFKLGLILSMFSVIVYIILKVYEFNKKNL